MYGTRELPLHKIHSARPWNSKTRLSRRSTRWLQHWCRVGIAVVLIVSAVLLISQAGARNSLAGQHHSGGHPVVRRASLSSLQVLVLVACHAVFTGHDYTRHQDFDSWFLLDYQKVPGQTESLLQHMQLGVKAAAGDPTALLVFSGGQTREGAGARSEAQSYRNVAQAAGWFGQPEVAARAVTEEHARDSFENLMFSICRFREVTGHYPKQITVASFEFKHARFADLHLKALRWPTQKFRFLGTPALSPQALQGEAQTVTAFRHDLYGCSTELREKRAARDPWHLGPHPADQCPEMRGLLAFCGPDVYKGQKPLPWWVESPLRQTKGLEHLTK